MIGLDPPWCVAKAHGAALATGHLKRTPEDFQVDEELAFEPAGEGEHLMVQLRKRDRTTDQIARQLARLAGARSRNIGYCGMKDRYAVTSQWFSLPWPIKRELPDCAAWSDQLDNAECLQLVRHDRKLRRGAHASNRFRIAIELVTPVDAGLLQRRIDEIGEQGVPNAFGPQRFGRQGRNLDEFESRERPAGIILSAARSALFNRVLNARVRDGTWNRLIDGEWCMLNRSNSGFVAEAIDDELAARAGEGDVHPSGPLPGRAADGPVGEAQAREVDALSEAGAWIDKLATLRVDGARRPLRVIPDGLCILQHDTGSLTLSFGLPPGSFATAVVAECIDTDEYLHQSSSSS